MISEPLYSLLDFNIDRYLNPYIPRNHIYRLPKPVSHFLGWRDKPSKEPPATVQWLLTVLSTLAGLLTVGAVFNFAPGIQSWKPPPMIASLGAAAILEYNAVRAPFAQPRNFIVGHTLSAVVAVAVAKLFMLAPGFYAEYMWIASCVSCAAASLVMSMTNTVYPPGGATAILAVVDTEIMAMGWTLPAVILLASCIMLPVAFLLNNTLRQFPIYWWTPDEVGSKLYRRDGKEHDEKAVEDSDVEKGDVQTWSNGSEGYLSEDSERTVPHARGDEQAGLNESKVYLSDSQDSERTLSYDNTVLQAKAPEIEILPGLEAIHIAPYMIRMPEKIELSDAEAETLRAIMLRLRTPLGYP